MERIKSPMPQLLVCEICSPLSFSYPLLQIYQHLLNICYKYCLVYGWPIVAAQKSTLFSQGPDQEIEDMLTLGSGEGPMKGLLTEI